MNILYNRALIFDGSHALHRSLCQPELWNMKTSYGKRTGGILGVLKTILKEFKLYNYYPIVVFDGGLSERRLEIYPNYKHYQDKLLEESLENKSAEQLMEEEFRREYNTQRNDLIELLPLFGIPVIQLPGWEGDDLIYILTKLSKDSIVVSDDKDLLQLITDPSAEEPRRCQVKRGMRDEFWNIDTLKEMGIDINEYIGCKAICGDNSDNIPSACYQVGEKTALGLYKIYQNTKLTESNFPSNEQELGEICKKLNIPKRKAYLNFDEDQFLINVLLTDISLIDDEINEDLINFISRDIEFQSSGFDLQLVCEQLQKLEINSFDPNVLINMLAKIHCVLDINEFDSAQSICEINVRKTLF